MIKSIIFDIGMVLADYNWSGYLQTFAYSEETYQAVANAVFLSPTWVECDRGVLSDQELLSGFICNAPEYEKEIKEVYATVGGCIKQYDYAIPWIQELKKKGLGIYALSNYGERMFAQTGKELNFLEYMDGALISYQDHLIKPDPRIYQTLLNRYHLNPDETVFFDDNEDNVKGASDLGIHAFLFHNYEEAAQQLEALLKV